MSHRDDIIAILEGRSPERIPWSPRLEIWYQAHCRRGTLPDRYAGWSLRQIERHLGMATPARGGRIFRKELRHVEVEEKQDGEARRTFYHTPIGTVSTCFRQTDELAQVGVVGLEVEHLIKTPQDYAIAEYIIQHTEIVPTYQQYLTYEEEIADDGFPIVPIGQDPMSALSWELIGAEQLYYHLQDCPDQVHHLLGVLNEQAQVILDVALRSPARLFLHGEHFDSFLTPPKIFSKYMLPYFQSFSKQLHDQGKWLACHADSDTSKLLELILQAGFDLAECFVTAPMARVTLEQARAIWGKKVIIWGGIPSIMLCDQVTDADFESYLKKTMCTLAPGDAIILGVADNVVPEAKIERIERISSLLARIGQYPIEERL